MNTRCQIQESIIQSMSILVGGDPIHSRCRILPQGMEAVGEKFLREHMQQIVEWLIRTSPRAIGYPLQ
jgi:hypothetical protein